jgi:hypothetical protein
VYREAEQIAKNECEFDFIESHRKALKTTIEGLGKITSMDCIVKICANVCCVIIALFDIQPGNPVPLLVNVRRRRRPGRTSAASAWSLVPAPHATAPAPRQGGLATVATRASAAVAPTRWRRSTGSSVKRTIVELAALLLDFDNVLVGRSTPPFPSLELTMLSRTTTTRTNWRGAKTTTPLDTQYSGRRQHCVDDVVAFCRIRRGRR